MILILCDFKRIAMGRSGVCLCRVAPAPWAVRCRSDAGKNRVVRLRRDEMGFDGIFNSKHGPLPVVCCGIPL